MGKDLLPWVALVALAVLPYASSLGNPLLYDDRTLLDNAWLAREASIGSVFSHDYWFGTRHAGSGLYRPVTVLSLAWNLRLAGSRLGFRLVNALLHGLVALEVAWLLWRILRPDSARLPFAAWVGAALFAVHPLASEAVLWAVGRAEILAALLGIAAFCVSLTTPKDARGRVARLGLSLALLFLALLSKESAASWILIGALPVAFARDRRSDRWGSRWTWTLGSLLTLAAFLILRGRVIGWGVEPADPLDNPLLGAGGATRLVNAVLLQGRYLAKMVFPFPQSVDYGYDQIHVVLLFPWGALGATLLAALWLAVLWRLLRSPRLAFLWAFVPAAFAVTGNFLFPIGTIFAERLAYLPLLGFSGLCACALDQIGSRGARASLAALLLLLAASRTVARGLDYRSLEIFTEATARASPRSVKALLNLGRTRLELQNRPADALPPLERAVSLAPDQPRVLRLLAEAHRRLGHTSLADEYARKAGMEDQR